MRKKIYSVLSALTVLFFTSAILSAGQESGETTAVRAVRDGVNFFPQRNILCLANHDNIIYWGTSKGLFGYDPANEELIRYATGTIPYILNGTELWAVRTPALLYRYRSAGRPWQSIEPPAGLRGRDIRGLAQTENYLWVGSSSLPPGRQGIVLWRYNTTQASWENMSLSEMEIRIDREQRLPAYDYANIIVGSETGLIIFGEFRTYFFDPEINDWEEITSAAERQEAVRAAFYSPILPFSRRLYPGSDNSIKAFSNLWWNSLRLPSAFSTRITAVVQENQGTWLATDSGLLRSGQYSGAWDTLSPAQVKVNDVILAGDFIWAALRQQGVLQLSLDIDWSRFQSLTLSDISPAASEMEVEGLISIDEAYPNKELSLIEHWQARKRNYYVITGEYTEEMQQYIGKIVKVSGRATLLRRFDWGGKYYRLDILKIIEVR